MGWSTFTVDGPIAMIVWLNESDRTLESDWSELVIPVLAMEWSAVICKRLILFLGSIFRSTNPSHQS